jgi:type II secretory pathway component PulC
MGRPLRLLNLTLGVVAVLIATALAKTWISPAVSITDRPVPKLSQEATSLAFVPLARPPLPQFDVIVEKNPFKQPPPMPPQRIGLQPVPPPAPLPTLVGTVLVDEERRAMLSDKGKQEIYAVNQEVAGGVITEIRDDRIMYKRGDESVEIFLKVAIETVPSSSGKALVPTAPALMAPLPGAKLDKLEKGMLKQQQKAQKQQGKVLRQQPKNQ